MFDNVVRVYSKNMELIAVFTGETAGIGEDAKKGLMVSPTVRAEQNSISTLSFQMLAKSEKWNQIKDPENLYHLNDHWYTALSENAYKYDSDEGVSIVNVTLVETCALLAYSYHQVYNCGIYTYAKAKFVRYVEDGAVFTIDASDCVNPGNTVSSEKSWEQVKLWKPADNDGNKLTYSILTSDEYKPVKWENAPTGVFMKSVSLSGNTITVTIEARAKQKVSEAFPYESSKSYKLDVKPLPATIEGVKINSTLVSDGEYTTSEKDATFSYSASTGVIKVNYTAKENEIVNGVIITYNKTDLGDISSGATCTFAYGAEAVDEHTFVVLPKADKKYKLTIDEVSYEDSQVRDARGEVMPRGSAGYAMWAALKNTGWSLGICDVLAKGFDASIDYGCFNVESDMKDALSNIRYIRDLYGGILCWDSEHKVLNYRAENDVDYQAYKDGFSDWTGYEFREGKNMLEKPVITYDNNVITKAYILGYGNLNIKKVNNGKVYIEDYSYTDEVYEGYLSQPLIYDTNDDGGQKQLLYWGKRELSKQAKPRRHIELDVTDLRVVPEHSHEIFDINDVVRVYYWDEQTKKAVSEDQRIVVWEYNAFAMEESTVELGDKTQNSVELFKLIYNKSLKSPDANNSGDISSNNVHMNGIGWGGNGDSYWGSGSPDSLTRYIELIARTTTDNSDAIAGLILDTSEIHSKVDLFAMYQKQTDTMFTQTYAGLQLYADEKKAEAILSANKYTEEASQALSGQINTTITQTEANLKLYADSASASAEMNAKTYTEKVRDGLVTSINTTEANVKAYADRVSASASLNAQTAAQKYVDGKLTNYYTAAQVEAYASRNYASISSVATLENNIAGIYQYVDDEIASIDIRSEVNTAIEENYPAMSNITLERGTISMYSDPSGSAGALLELDRYGDINLSCSTDIILSADRYIEIGHRNTRGVSMMGYDLGFGVAYLKDQNGNNISIQYISWE